MVLTPEQESENERVLEDFKWKKYKSEKLTSLLAIQKIRSQIPFIDVDKEICKRILEYCGLEDMEG